MKQLRTVFSPEIFSACFFTALLLGSVPCLQGAVSPLLKCFFVYALAVVLFDAAGEKRILRGKGKILLLLFAAGCGLSMLLRRDSSGIMELLYLGMLLLVVPAFSPERRRLRFGIFAFLGFLLAAMQLVGIVMFFTGFQRYYPELDAFMGLYPHESRLCGCFGNPNVLGAMAFLGIALHLICLYLGGVRRKSFYGIAMTVNLLGLILSSSRTYTICFCILLACAAAVYAHGRDLSRVKLLVTAIAAVAAAAAVIGVVQMGLVHLRQYLVEIGLFAEVDYTDELLLRANNMLGGRTALWLEGLRLFLAHPILGGGYRSVNHALVLMGREALENGGNLHSAYIEFAASFGLWGLGMLGLYLLLLLGNLRRLLKYCAGEKRPALILLCALLFAMLVSGLMESAMESALEPMAVMLWMVIGSLYAETELELTPQRRWHPALSEVLMDRAYRGDRSVCLIDESLAGGGAEFVLLNAANALSESGLDVTVMTLWSGGVLEQRLSDRVRLVTADPFDFMFFKRVLYYINRHYLPIRLYNSLFLNGRHAYTVAFLEGLPTKLAARTKLRPDGKRFAWVHTDLEKDNWTEKYFAGNAAQREAYAAYDAIYCVSDAAKEAFDRLMDLPEITFVQYNLVDTRRVERLAKDPCPEKRPEGLLVCAVGRLNEQKGNDRLLRSHIRLQEAGIPHALWILGEGGQRPELERIIAEHHAEGSVRLMGFCENPYCYAAQADIFVCPSRVEGFSLVVTENLALEKPILATRCAGVVEQLEDGKYGLITENDDDALTEGLRRLLTDDALRAHYAAMAAEKKRQLSYEVTLAQYLSIFERSGGRA